MTVSYLRKHGGNHLIFCYSSGIEPQTKQDYLERYPGDNCVDLVGFDAYQYGSRETFQQDLNRLFCITEAVGTERRKLVALTEVGYEALPDADWWTGALLPVLKQYAVSYILAWRNAREKENHFFAPYPGQISAPDFVKFYKDPYTLFESDLKNLYK